MSLETIDKALTYGEGAIAIFPRGAIKHPCPYQKPHLYAFWLTKKLPRWPKLLGFGANLFRGRVQRHKQSRRTLSVYGCSKCSACSGGDAFVAMMESANLWDLHDPTHGRRLNRSADGCVLAQ